MAHLPSKLHGAASLQLPEISVRLRYLLVDLHILPRRREEVGLLPARGKEKTRTSSVCQVCLKRLETFKTYR